MPQKYTVGPVPGWFDGARVIREVTLPNDYPLPLQLISAANPDGSGSAVEIRPFDPISGSNVAIAVGLVRPTTP